jgi:endoribonuclease Dicer
MNPGLYFVLLPVQAFHDAGLTYTLQTHLFNVLALDLGCQDYCLLAKELPMESPGTKPKVMAGLIVHETVLCHSIAESGRYAKLRASKKALEELKGLAPYEFRNKFRCDCTPPEEGEKYAELTEFATAVGT